MSSGKDRGNAMLSLILAGIGRAALIDWCNGSDRLRKTLSQAWAAESEASNESGYVYTKVTPRLWDRITVPGSAALCSLADKE
jgi:hypothetical protein